jgi:hypothetical protein
LSRPEGWSTLARVFSIRQNREGAVSNPESKHWSDEKADVVAVLTIFVSLVLAAIHFISTPV